MKNLLFLLLTLGPVSLLQAVEQRFDPEFEKKCFKEVARLKCGSPDGKHNKAFMKCVDSKIERLSPGCQEMHKSLSAENHEGHSH